jgi:hypothetical protein
LETPTPAEIIWDASCANMSKPATVARQHKSYANTLNHAKHIDVRVHLIRELVRCGVVSVEYVPTAINEADALTKPVEPTVLKEALPRIGLEICEDAEDLMDSCGGVLRFKAACRVMRSCANRCTCVRAECGC